MYTVLMIMIGLEGVILWFSRKVRLFGITGDVTQRKQAQFGLRLPDSGPENPSKPIRLQNVKISPCISPRLPKYDRNGLEKRGSPRPLLQRLIFPGGLPV